MLEILELVGVTLNDMKHLIDSKYSFIFDDEILMQRIKIYALYAREEKRQYDEINDIKFNESIYLPTDFDYNKISLSLQAKEILFKYKPTTLGAATRIPGITAATIHTLLVYFKKEKLFKSSKKSVNF